MYMANRWHLAEGRVVGVRLPDGIYAMLKARADKRGMTLSGYARLVIEREVARKR